MSAAVHAAALGGGDVLALAGGGVLAAHQQVAVSVPLGPSFGWGKIWSSLWTVTYFTRFN